MLEELEQRVSELTAEQHRGQQMLAALENRQVELRQTRLLAAAEPQAAGGLTGNGSALPAMAATAGNPTGMRP